VRQEPGAQEVDAIDRLMPPVPSNLRCHNVMPT
jgi:hypothetical protein